MGFNCCIYLLKLSFLVNIVATPFYSIPISEKARQSPLLSVSLHTTLHTAQTKQGNRQPVVTAVATDSVNSRITTGLKKKTNPIHPKIQANQLLSND